MLHTKSSAKEQRTIIIGDVHGCYYELDDLLQKLEYQIGLDELYFTGDIINRGWYSKLVYNKIKQTKARAVLGNHELHLILEEAGEVPKKPWVDKIRSQFGSEFDEFMADIKTWPLSIETEDFLLVHGGLVPGLLPGDTDPLILTRIRTWDEDTKDISNPDKPAWFEFYKGDKLVVFGHWAALEGVVRKNVIGLDTGCVYGKKLTALILPQRELISVKAREVYRKIKY